MATTATFGPQLVGQVEVTTAWASTLDWLSPVEQGGAGGAKRVGMG